MINKLILTFIISLLVEISFQNDILNNYSEFLNFGERKVYNKNKINDEYESIAKIEFLGDLLKTYTDAFKNHTKIDIIFLIDASSSVGENNFQSELKFVKKLLSDVIVDYNHTRVAVVTFSSPSSIVKNIDQIGKNSEYYNKCVLLTKQLKQVRYRGGETFTLGALKKAKEILDASNRTDSQKVIFLITDGYSNGGDPVPIANELKLNSVIIFTIGIRNGNYKELYGISSSPGQFYSYLLDSFSEFESLARRALHSDLKHGDYIPLGTSFACNELCTEGENCCDEKAMCTCGTSTGHYSCVCKAGYYGTGLRNNCFSCASGTYSNGPNLCLPCPDPFHITTSPAYGIDSCTCKEGYKANLNRECKEIKCTKVTAPENGYYVKNKMCPNVIFSACGVRCEVGYTLKGTSVRLCQQNGTWSGIEPSCEIKTCDHLNISKGKMECFQPDTKERFDSNTTKVPVDTVCRFRCNEGHILTGSKERICLPITRWSGLQTICKPMKCKKLLPVNFGNVEPSSCTNGKQEYGKVCRVVCDDGFKIEGPSEKRCVKERGNWDSTFEATTCVDVTPPSMSCPANIETNSVPGKKYGHVNWNEPIVTDNSNLSVSVWTKPAINPETSKFEIGTTTVTYFALDAFQNQANCSFDVIIKDVEPPIIENCLDPPTYLTTNSQGANITWDEPLAFDNSQNVTLFKSIEFGFFKIGTTTVTYIATDNSNNTSTCKLNITVEVSKCEPLPDPLNGQSKCINQTNGITCFITCDEGYGIPITEVAEKEDDTLFICNNVDPVWYGQDEFFFPECSVTQIPEEIQYGEVTISEEGTCNELKSTETAKNDVLLFVNNEFCTDNCTIGTEVECNNDETDKIFLKRDVNKLGHPNRGKKHKKKVKVKYQLKRKYDNSSHALTNSQVQLKNGRQVYLTYQTNVICPIGFVRRGKKCVHCPRGTFHNETKGICQSCPFGQYNDQVGQLSCNRCPPHYSTGKMRSKKFENCREKCAPGTHARKKYQIIQKKTHNVTVERLTLQPFCTSCGIGNFQPNYGQLKCIPCPPGYTTTGIGSTGIEQCIPTAAEICNGGICNNGTCLIINNYEYTCNCFDNYIGSHCDQIIDICQSQPCYNGGTCSPTVDGYTCVCKDGYTGTLCDDYIETCTKHCLNNGICYVEDNGNSMCLCPEGYNGDLCEIKINPCLEHYCENNSTCVPQEEHFNCKCPPGFFGSRCHLLPCDYLPCNSTKLCINLVEDNATRNSYSCVCPDGYTGENCEEKINYCKNSPCLNKGTCINELTNYTCTCSSLFFGPNCELRKNTEYTFNFNQYSTNNYIKLKPFSENLTEISTCFWIQTLDEINYGTIISYASRFNDNAFTLTDYTGLVLYVNNKYIVTDIHLNDGMWHHLCVTWTQINGTYNIFVDGYLKHSGFNLSTSQHIEGHGSLVLAQDQDILGGDFSLSESFVGKLTYVDFWSSLLTYEEILKHFNDCQGSFFGNLYAWPIMQDFIQGDIQIEHSTFCKTCEDPKPLYNGIINIEQNVAYYSCYPGFTLNTPEYLKGRKCSKSSQWEGYYEPYCKKMFCGYPSSIRNGYTIGNRYYYQDKIIFGCYEGYTMIGAPTIICNATGKWYPEKPQCVGTQRCPAFQKPEFSNLLVISDQSFEDYKENRTQFDIGTQIEFSCNENYEIIGNVTISCLESGNWDLTPPKCISTATTKPTHSGCSIEQVPQPPSNGYVDMDSYNAVLSGIANSIEYKCNTGYKLVGENSTSCILDGYWTEPNISCKIITCGPTPKFKNMILDDKDEAKKIYNYDHVVNFKCENGYDKLGTSLTIRCLISGKWSRIQGKCLRKSCGKPDIADDTEISGRSYLFGDKVTISCKSKSSYVLTCNEVGLWEGEKDDTC